MIVTWMIMILQHPGMGYHYVEEDIFQTKLGDAIAISNLKVSNTALTDLLAE